MTREIVLRIPEERAALEFLVALCGAVDLANAAQRPVSAQTLADLRDLLQRAVDEAAQERLRKQVD